MLVIINFIKYNNMEYENISGWPIFLCRVLCIPGVAVLPPSCPSLPARPPHHTAVRKIYATFIRDFRTCGVSFPGLSSNQQDEVWQELGHYFDAENMRIWSCPGLTVTWLLSVLLHDRPADCCCLLPPWQTVQICVLLPPTLLVGLGKVF